MWQQISQRHPPSPKAHEVPREEPRLAAPDAPAGELRATFIGHATFLLQWGGINVLTDPHFSKRASPLSWAGPKRFSPPGLSIQDLPTVHAVVVSHDHYDHLDETSIRALHRRFGDDLVWITPLAYRGWFARQGITNLRELDWEAVTELDQSCGLPQGATCSIQAHPAQHWTRRGREINQRLWASYSLRFRSPAGHAHDLYFGGDSGYWTGYRDLGEAAGPWDTLLLPIGAYEPRWFMRHSHMNPEDAVQAYRDLGGTGHCVGMHWGTFRLTFEAPLEPPGRFRTAWESAGLPEERCHTPGIGGTVVVQDRAATGSSG